MNDFPQDPSLMIEMVNRTAEETAVRVAATADWGGLIQLAMAGIHEPLRHVLQQIGTTRTNLYPPELREFLALMDEHKLKDGRPPKDEEIVRAAARAWRLSYLTSTKNVVADAFKGARKVNKHRNRRTTIKTDEGLISIRTGSSFGSEGEWIKRPYADLSATERALQTMSKAGFGTSADSLRNEIYPRKKGTTKKSK